MENDRMDEYSPIRMEFVWIFFLENKCPFERMIIRIEDEKKVFFIGGK